MKDYSYQGYAEHYDKREVVGRYNWKYRQSMRESDKRMLALVEEKAAGCESVRLIDLGCGNGNFLHHLKRRHPGWLLTGMDLAETLISECRADKDLNRIRFEVGDLTAPPRTEERNSYDVVVLIAVLQVLPPAVFGEAVASICAYLKPGGWLLNFDGYHPFPEHQVVRVEVCADQLRPEFPTMNYYYPSRHMAAAICREAGFSQVEYEDFYMPFDLPRPAGNAAASHTEQLVDGRRLSMLGVIAQPWTFLMARKG